MKFTKQFIAFIILFSTQLFTISFAQSITTTVKGRVVDIDSKSPIESANVILPNTNPLISTITDENGYFRVENVPVGRVDVQISVLGFDERWISNLQVISGKETNLTVELQESFGQLDEVILTSKKNKFRSANNQALVSAKNLSIEESNRYAGGIGDPARLVSSFAGVSSSGEGNNDIIVRGNNPRFVQWRLEGTEIPNPNHFAQEGLSGGPVSALNSRMLANSKFYSGAFAPQYGNVLSSIFDVGFRTGNADTREHSFSVGVLGIDFTTEGPISTKGKSSYLLNYRYSTLGLLDQLGALSFGGAPNYQDLSFKFFIPTKRFGTFSLFGLGGISNANLEFNDIDDEDNDDENDEITSELEQKSLLGIVGLKHALSITEKATLNSTLAYSNSGNENLFSRKFDSDVLENSEDTEFLKGTFRINTALNYKLNANHNLTSGVVLSYHNFDFTSTNFDPDSNRFITDLDIDGTASTSQFFASWKWKINERIELVNGIHSHSTSLNPEVTVEPRSSIRYNFANKQIISAGFGKHSNFTSLSNYYSIVPDENGLATNPNTDLKLLKARHYVIGYENNQLNNIHFKAEAYYQDLFDIPVEQGTSYSLINQLTDFTDRRLTNTGKARNYGLELTAERYFEDNYYFLVTASIYNSEYRGGDTIWRNSRFNGHYVGNILLGKEFLMGKNSANILSVNTRIGLQGGRRLLPIDLESSIENGAAIYQETGIFEEKGDDVFNLNLAVSYRMNRKRTSHEFKVDIQNITNNQATLELIYNDINQKIEEIKQLSLLPIISYTLNF